jgi:drug/metabolite transporter (DMT)-like permease
VSRVSAPIDRSVVIPFVIFTLVWSSTWIVIRDQLGPQSHDSVAPQWSVAYRFLIAAAAMFAVARWNGDRLGLDRGGLIAASFIGVTQFCINFNAVYLAERYITSGIVATVFAILLIPNALFAWALLGHRPGGRFVAAGAVAVAGVGLLFLNEIRSSPVPADRIMVGLGFTLLGLIGASLANVYQALEGVKRVPLFTLLAWSMAIGAVLDVLIAFFVAGPPTFDPRPGYIAGLLYLALAASVLCFSLYFPVVRKIGPGKAAYSSVMVPIIAMALSTAFEGYRWSPLAISGAALAIGGMLLALGGRRRPLPVASPDAG